ncbi:MAG: PHP domain-containing protein [Deltaproteobacteria bacterium]|jgi:predicted metal-dependent phosphoesterase TrpH|nr:PHP domain-containing protein [Deltaproteobacteria bacterium]MBT4642805.1 PHP domain-containing protein [Deltaproteobacteria bacterium]MBT6499306.1 PHP domain-containing protein [Deltaproteobacteria bacterium]MBT6612380.1 PHP domain-containing protein [Deltaproteobacteria bacterium]MBT7155603.1 PHP domain-containing protein [Deltaproteobacteria bacterium]
MKIDLHLHTHPRSQCSYIDPADLVAEAKKIGLDGICLTEHQVLWDDDAVRELASDSGLMIFRGNEITTAQGDVLVFGLEKDIQGIITIQELQQEVQAAGAYSILAHPFRGFKTFGVSDLQMSVDQACKKKALQYVNAVEIRNGKVTVQDNEMARKVAERLELPGTGGSDAHNLDDIGTYVTVFEQDIQDDRQLVAALHGGIFTIGEGRIS